MKLSDILFHSSGLEYVIFLNSECSFIESFFENEIPEDLLSSCFDDWFFKVDPLNCLVLCVIRKDC